MVENVIEHVRHRIVESDKLEGERNSREDSNHNVKDRDPSGNDDEGPNRYIDLTESAYSLLDE